MASVNFYLKSPKAKKKTLIYLQFTYFGKRLRYSTGESVLPSKWDFKRKRAKGDIGLNSHLNSLSGRILIAYKEITRSERIKPSPAKLKRKFEEILTLEDISDDIFKHFDQFCEARQMKGTSKGTIKTYQQLQNNLRRFSVEKRFSLEYDRFDNSFYSTFIGYLFQCGLKNNTVGKNIKTLKTFLYFATEEGWNKNMAFKNFEVLKEKVETIYLNKEEVKRLYEYDLSDKPNYERARDLFIIGCWTGLRFGDFSQIQKAHIKRDGKGRDVLTIKTEKTGKTVSIPLHHIVKAILKKYKYSLPKCPTNQDMNRKLKKIGEWLGLDDSYISVRKQGQNKHKQTFKKYELITTHTARRSFATNLYYDGYPSRLLMQITGHTTESNFLKYIKVNNDLAVSMLNTLFDQYEKLDKRDNKLKVI